MLMNHRIQIRVSETTKENLKNVWSKRFRRDPDNPKKWVRFCSMNEYLNYIIRVTNKFRDEDFTMFANFYDPDIRL